MVCAHLIFFVLQLKLNLHDKVPSSGGRIHDVVSFTVEKKRRSEFCASQSSHSHISCQVLCKQVN